MNGAVLRMRPEKPRPRVTAGVQRPWAPSIGLNFAAMVTSPYKCKILARDVKPWINKQSIFYVNGETTPIRPMKLDFGDNKNYVTLCNMYQSSERWFKDESLIIDRKKCHLRLWSRPHRSQRRVYKSGTSRKRWSIRTFCSNHNSHHQFHSLLLKSRTFSHR
jgi:hypothetical protein